MAVEKSAVREGTRWDFRGRTVEVADVTDRYVVYRECDGDDVRGYTLAAPLNEFLFRAESPEEAKHFRMLSTFRRGAEGCEKPEMVARAIAYLLERVGPPPAGEA